MGPEDEAADRPSGFHAPPTDIVPTTSTRLRPTQVAAFFVAATIASGFWYERTLIEDEIEHAPIPLPSAGPLHPAAFGPRPQQQLLPPPPVIASQSEPEIEAEPPRRARRSVTDDEGEDDKGDESRASESDESSEEEAIVQLSAAPIDVGEVIRVCRFDQACIISRLEGRADDPFGLGVLAEAYSSVGNQAGHRRTVALLKRRFPRSDVARHYR